ncbi:sulfotransferase family 2 domain-containing protein [Microcoleus sp. MOSTC5]|uniref:sulfotransferase family 2 domain-containing protein n=1 Tax=Microcoleus sp. MOSTC5 TaxID=3055378 RepID=UPI002FD2F7CA
MKAAKNSAENIKKDLIIFTHIPKTAGTSLRHILMQQYGKNAVFMFYDDPTVTTKNAEELLNELRSYFQYFPEVNDQNFNSLVKLRAISGHKPFGIHNLLPLNNFHYITLLREPIERVISFYYHVFGRTEHSLEYLISCKQSIEFDNLQVRMLSGVGWKVPYGHCSCNMLEQAKHNLLHYYTFGIQDRFPESLETFSRHLGWSQIQIVAENVGKNKPKSSDIGQQTLHLIAEQNLLDIELYQFAKQLFEEQQKTSST